MSGVVSGKCLCGDVVYSAPTPHEVDICHCGMCRRWTGSAFIGVDFQKGQIEFSKSDSLTWYKSSDWAERGFCKSCGSSLFYRLQGEENFIAVSAGTLTLPEGLTIEKEIFIDEKPDYYDFMGSQKKMTGAEFFAALQDTKS